MCELEYRFIDLARRELPLYILPPGESGIAPDIIERTLTRALTIEPILELLLNINSKHRNPRQSQLERGHSIRPRTDGRTSIKFDVDRRPVRVSMLN